MTEQEKERVKLLRESGYSYGQIAENLSISVNTIRSHCKRHNLEVKEHKDVLFCKNCGKPLGEGKLKYCSRKCKTDWWNHHPKQQKGQMENVCSCCGKLFFSYPRQNRKYCSHSCYIKKRFACNSIETE